MPIQFGTDGWRDIIADNFTYANLRVVAQAHAQALRQRGGKRVVVGYDTRFQGAAFAEVVAQVMAQQGLDVLLSQSYLPTPALSFAVVHHQAAGGVMLTASHNPPAYSGYKMKGPYGGSATPALVAEVEAALADVQGYSGPAGTICPLDIRAAYYAQLDKQLDLPTLRQFRGTVLHDAMGGAACGWLSGYVRHARLPLNLQEVRERPDPLFYGVNPEPITQNLEVLHDLMVAQPEVRLSVVTDGDADRVGAMTTGGQFFNSHQIFAVLLQHLYQRGLRGRVVKTVSGSRVIELLTQQLGLELLETPVGFKYITDAFLAGQQQPGQAVLMGGEESGGLSSQGHIPERDGLLNSLLMIEVLARTGRGLEDIFADIERQVGFVHHYDRSDLHLPLSFDKAAFMRQAATLNQIAGQPVAAVTTLDGVKLHLYSGASVMFRASGTEPVVRVYVEAQSPQELSTLMQEALHLIEQQS